METRHESKDLPENTPFLAGVPAMDPFVVPEGFFERFPHQVQAAVVDARPERRSWSRWRRWAIATPTAALIAVGVWKVLPGSTSTQDPANISIASVSDAELDEFADDELLAALEETPALATTDLGAVDLELNDDELLAYLEHEEADLTELMIDTE